MPNINIDDAYILGETGAQVDKVTGLFTKDEDTTSGEKAFAQLNIGTAGSNRNLLDNPFFTVNQRDFTSVTGTNNVYTVDRWKINNGGGTGSSITRTGEGYIKLQTGSTYISYQQMFGSNELAGKTVTMSVNDAGIIYSHTFTVPARGSADVLAETFAFKTECDCHFFVMNTSSAYGYIFQLSIGQGYSATIRAVKLELGSVSTLANDVPPDYGEELAKCQRYFLRIYGDPIGTGYIASGLGTVFILVPTGVTMRARPTVSYSGAFSVRVQGSTIGVSAMTFATPAHTGGGVGIVCTLSSNAGSVGACAMYPNAPTSYIDLSADL